MEKLSCSLGTDNKLLAIIAAQDKVRKTSRKAIKQLKELGIKHTIMLTGDNQTTANAIAEEVGINNVKS